MQSLRSKYEQSQENIKQLTLKEFVIKGCMVSVKKPEALYMSSEAIVIPTNERIKDLPATSKHIIKNGGKAHAIACHNGDPESRIALIEQIIRQFNLLDVLVNNSASNP